MARSTVNKSDDPRSGWLFTNYILTNMNGSSIIYTDFGLYAEQQKSEHLMLLLKHIYITVWNGSQLSVMGFFMQETSNF